MYRNDRPNWMLCLGERNTVNDTALSKAFLKKMKEMDMQERVRAAKEANAKRRAKIKALKKRLEIEKFKRDTGAIEA